MEGLEKVKNIKKNLKPKQNKTYSMKIIDEITSDDLTKKTKATFYQGKNNIWVHLGIYKDIEYKEERGKGITIDLKFLGDLISKYEELII